MFYFYTRVDFDNDIEIGRFSANLWDLNFMQNRFADSNKTFSFYAKGMQLAYMLCCFNILVNLLLLFSIYMSLEFNKTIQNKKL